VVKEKMGCGGEERAADFVAFDRASQEKAAHGQVAYAVQEVSKTASKRAQNGTFCPGNERGTVERQGKKLMGGFSEKRPMPGKKGAEIYKGIVAPPQSR
jgi:hypothetical protein